MLSAPATAVSIFHREDVGENFASWVAELHARAENAPGFDSARISAPEAQSFEWAWMQSDVRSAALPEPRKQLTGDFSAISHSTPFGSLVRVEDGRTQVTPDWKTAMLVLLVLYPTVMTLSRFVGPILDDVGAPPWLSMWLSQILSVGLMTYFFMPAVTGWFRRWLDPIDGAGRRLSLIGALTVVLVYALTLTVFASIKWLQFWDYLD
ncbi:hypothetical protein QMK17_02625 [Rhodococcus sp. G-MC3]|uniref:hypothetical protein n=1 Tax=Rhodococcus sp. G-MC3 TaxID=3046209 RepID=UPI0024BB95CE|nr:hypothetical protein [Rhodococcus sp. G-MC3]MDJ0392225.1 hypothetical protein [Rhodococcus sp. G-MC3]